MNIKYPKSLQLNSRVGGFTLIEMLVAVALVLLMMTMFAEIFSLATGTMSKQKALAELDQRQRMASTLLRADLQDRTFKRVIAIHPAEGLPFVSSSRTGGGGDNTFKRGYIYISENDPDDDGDDTLQFTVERNQDTGAVFFGQSKELLDLSGNGISANPNQPENDDGDPSNQVGSSRAAEVAYFLRNGILYRRVLLVRIPPQGATSDSPMTPSNVSLVQSGIYPAGSGMGGTIYVRNGAVATSRFPIDFDYSATYDYSASRVEFLGQHSLDNYQGSAVSLVLGLPSRRFGFQPTPNPALSRPVEFAGTAFVGRFTQEETSHLNFAYPGDPGLGMDNTYGTADDTNPYSIAPGLSVGANQTVTAYAGGSRQGEDILMTNVLAFDVKVWDSVLGQFVDVGHSGAFGEYAQVNNKNSAYGPNSAGGNRCFDTWHPNMNPLVVTTTPYSITNPPPFRPIASYGLDGVPGAVGDDDKDTVIDNVEEAGWPGSDDILSPMKAIQIRIRYRDISSGLVRDFTIVESLVTE